MQNDDAAAAERVNVGEPVAPVEFSLIERAWNRLSQLATDLPQRVGHLMAVAGNNPDLSSLSPDQRIAFTVRYAQLDALQTNPDVT